MKKNQELVGASKPDIMAEAKRIMAETGVGMNRALQQAAEIVREWAVANGYAQ